MDAATSTIHATCIAIGGFAAIIVGPSGSGKSDLAFRLLTSVLRDGARPIEPVLVADDQVVVERRGGSLYASPPASIAGLIEVRGIGIVEADHVVDAEILLAVDVTPGASIERLPDLHKSYHLLGLSVPLMRLRALEASAPGKVALRLSRLARYPR